MAQKSVLITGCSAGGIGDALAQTFHRRGLRVFATARNLSKIEHLTKLGIEVFKLDVVDSASVKDVAQKVSNATGGTLDILVNNAGTGRKGLCEWHLLSVKQLRLTLLKGYGMTVLDSDMDLARKLFELNVLAIISTTQAFSPLLIKSQGLVVNTGSIVGITPVPFQGLYNASKAGVHMLSDTMRLELKPFGVRVSLVSISMLI